MLQLTQKGEGTNPRCSRRLLSRQSPTAGGSRGWTGRGGVLLGFVLLLVAVGEARAQYDLDIESVGFAPRETTPLGDPGHWWELHFRVRAKYGWQGRGQVRLVVSRKGGAELYSVQRSFTYRGRSRHTVRLPIFWGAARSLALDTTLIADHGRELGHDHTVALAGARYVIAVVGREPFALAGLLKRIASSESNDPLKQIPYTMATPTTSLGGTGALLGRRVLVPRVRSVPLPHHALCWSAISHVIWLDVSPTVLTPDQFESLRLWLHWGGTLVLSGGQHAGVWQSGPFRELLPASDGGTRDIELTSESGRSTIRLSGLELTPRGPETVLIRSPGGQTYAAEWRIGRGRVVQAAFALTDPAFEEWAPQASYWKRLLLGANPAKTGPTGVRIFARDLGRSATEHLGALDVDGPCTQTLLEYIYKACSEPQLWASRSTVVLLLGGYLVLVGLAHAAAVRRRSALNWSLLPLISIAYLSVTVLYVTRLKGGYAEIQLAESFVDFPYVRRTAFVGTVSRTPGYAQISGANPGVLLAPLDVLRTEVREDTVFPGRLSELGFNPTTLHLNVYPIVPRAILAEGYKRCDAPPFVAADEAVVRNNAPMELKDVVLVGEGRCLLLARRWPVGGTIKVPDIVQWPSGGPGGGPHKQKACLVEDLVDDPLYRKILELVHASSALPKPFLLAWSEDTEPLVEPSFVDRAALKRTIWCISLGGASDGSGKQR